MILLADLLTLRPVRALLLMKVYNEAAIIKACEYLQFQGKYKLITQTRVDTYVYE